MISLYGRAIETTKNGFSSPFSAITYLLFAITIWVIDGNSAFSMDFGQIRHTGVSVVRLLGLGPRQVDVQFPELANIQKFDIIVVLLMPPLMALRSPLTEPGIRAQSIYYVVTRRASNWIEASNEMQKILRNSVQNSDQDTPGNRDLRIGIILRNGNAEGMSLFFNESIPGRLDDGYSGSILLQANSDLRDQLQRWVDKFAHRV